MTVCKKCNKVLALGKYAVAALGDLYCCGKCAIEDLGTDGYDMFAETVAVSDILADELNERL